MFHLWVCFAIFAVNISLLYFFEPYQVQICSVNDQDQSFDLYLVPGQQTVFMYRYILWYHAMGMLCASSVRCRTKKFKGSTCATPPGTSRRGILYYVWVLFKLSDRVQPINVPGINELQRRSLTKRPQEEKLKGNWRAETLQKFEATDTVDTKSILINDTWTQKYALFDYRVYLVQRIKIQITWTWTRISESSAT